MFDGPLWHARLLVRATALLTALGASAERAAAQEEEEFRITEVTAMTPWDPDGAGPKNPVLAVAGRSPWPGNPLQNYIGLFDPETGIWRELGRGLDGSVRAVEVLPTGDLVVAGAFAQAGGVPAWRVARWDGTRWHAFGAGIDDEAFRFVSTLAVGRGPQRGVLHIGGSFEYAGVERAVNLARFEPRVVDPGVDVGVDPAATGNAVIATAVTGTPGHWRPLGRGIEGRVLGCIALGDGAVVAVGEFELAGQVRANNVARWDGENWHPFGLGVDGEVRAAVPVGGGAFVVIGTFDHAGGLACANVARWTGKAWAPLHAGLDEILTCVIRQPDGNVVVGTANAGVHRFDGTVWRPIGELDTVVECLAEMPDGRLFAGGFGLFTWRGGRWIELLPAVE